jgi:hypothetical protein
MDAGRAEPQQLRQSIRLLKDALQEWESNAIDEMQCTSQPAPPSESPPLVALQEALARLSPHETSKVKAFLDNREQQNVSSHTSAMQSYGHPGMMPQHELSPYDQFLPAATSQHGCWMAMPAQRLEPTHRRWPNPEDYEIAQAAVETQTRSGARVPCHTFTRLGQRGFGARASGAQDQPSC